MDLNRSPGLSGEGGASSARKTPAAGNSAQFSESLLPNGGPRATLDVEETASRRSASKAKLWVHRLAVLLFVFFCAVVGVVLVVFPWRDEWTNNSLLVGYPRLQDLMNSGFVRGVCSGLGLLDIWIGFWEAVHYHE